MDKEETLRIHQHVYDWLKGGVIFTANGIIGPTRLLSLGFSYLGKAAITAATPLPAELVDAAEREPELKLHLASLIQLSHTPPAKIPKITSNILNDILARFRMRPKDAPDPTRELGVLYETLNAESSGVPERLAKEPAIDIITSFDELAKEDARTKHGFTWRLVTSKDPLKRPLAQLHLRHHIMDVMGGDKPYRDHVKALHIEIARQITNGQAHCRKTAELESRVQELLKEKTTLLERAKEAERALDEARKRPAAVAVEISPAQSQDELETYQKLVEHYEDEAREAISARKTSELKLTEAGRRIAGLSAMNDRLVQQLAETGKKGLSNGTDVKIYAANAFAERYASNIRTYVDRLYAKPGELVKGIEDAILRICHTIKDDGPAAAQRFPAFEATGLRVYKTQAGIRVLFSTNWKDTLVIQEVITPEEHSDAMAGGNAGRYRNILDGTIKFNKDVDCTNGTPKGFTRICYGLDELLKSQ